MAMHHADSRRLHERIVDACSRAQLMIMAGTGGTDLELQQALDVAVTKLEMFALSSGVIGSMLIGSRLDERNFWGRIYNGPSTYLFAPATLKRGLHQLQPRMWDIPEEVIPRPSEFRSQMLLASKFGILPTRG